jgi:hypothetical protein
MFIIKNKNKIEILKNAGKLGNGTNKYNLQSRNSNKYNFIR